MTLKTKDEYRAALAEIGPYFDCPELEQMPARFGDVNSDLKLIQISSCQRFKTDTPALLNTARVQPISATSLPLIMPA